MTSLTWGCHSRLICNYLKGILTRLKRWACLKGAKIAMLTEHPGYFLPVMLRVVAVSLTTAAVTLSYCCECWLGYYIQGLRPSSTTGSGPKSAELSLFGGSSWPSFTCRTYTELVDEYERTREFSETIDSSTYWRFGVFIRLWSDCFMFFFIGIEVSWSKAALSVAFLIPSMTGTMQLLSGSTNFLFLPPRCLDSAWLDPS